MFIDSELLAFILLGLRTEKEKRVIVKLEKVNMDGNFGDICYLFL